MSNLTEPCIQFNLTRQNSNHPDSQVIQKVMNGFEIDSLFIKMGKRGWITDWHTA